MAEKKKKKNERVQNHIASPTGIANDEENKEIGKAIHKKKQKR